MRTRLEENGYFTQPHQPDMLMLEIHRHEWVETGAIRNPNGTWSSVWYCKRCPDLGIGGQVGPIPPGFCRACGWVNHGSGKRCEECKTPLEAS